MVKIQDAHEYAAGRKPKVLIYGAPGVGKTVLAAQAPRPCLLLDFDGGAGYIANSIDVDGLQIASEIGMDELWGLALKLHAGEEFKFESLVVDSLTELQNLHRESILEERLSPSRQDYRINTEFLRRLLRILQNADITVVYTCLEDEVEDVDGIHKRPALTPALRRAVEAVVEVITYVAARTIEGENGGAQVERVALNLATDFIKAKDRTGVLPRRVRDPYWDTVYGNLYGEEVEE